MYTYEEKFSEFLSCVQACETPQDIKALYKKLIFEYHPDLHGEESLEASKALNAAYDQGLRNLSGQSFVGNDGEERTYNYNEAHEQAIREQLDKLIRLLPEDAKIEIEVIGLWVWVTGDTYSHRSVLKDKTDGCGMTWHSKRSAWYWKPYKGGRSRYRKDASLEDLAQTYGGRKVKRSKGQKSSSRKYAAIA